MKRRVFFKSLLAVAALAFAEPLALCDPKSVIKPVVNPAWETAEYEISWISPTGAVRGTLFTLHAQESEEWFHKLVGDMKNVRVTRFIRRGDQMVRVEQFPRA